MATKTKPVKTKNKKATQQYVGRRKDPDFPDRYIAEVEQRVKAAGLEATYVLEHGYCRSVYVVDPNGMTVEFTNDDPRAAAGDAARKANAHAELKRWLGGDWTSNNTFRSEEEAA